MKTILTFILMLVYCCGAYSQDSTLKIKQIDALVLGINTSTLPRQQDTLIQDHPEMGLKMTTYSTIIINGRELTKYVNLVNAIRKENTTVRQTTTSSSFYYNNNKLIKVEEYIIEGDQKKTADWYYSDNKPLYYTLQSDKAASRSTFLITMSEGILKQVIK